MATRYKLIHSGNFNDQLSQGLRWNSSTDTYTRLGAIYGIATATSAGDGYLPIHSQMKRCMIGISGFSYYIDFTITATGYVGNPINQEGTTSFATGTATSTTTGHLINTGGGFVSAGVIAGQVVHNTTNGKTTKYAVILAVAATDLTLALDIMASGDTYEIGTANYGGVDGECMVQVPKFYYKQSVVGTVHEWYISLYNLPNFTLHPAFWRDGVEVPYRYYSAFEGSMFDASAGTMCSSANIPSNIYAAGDYMCSRAGQWAKTNETRASYRAMATTNWVEFRQHDYYLHSAIQLLYLIEYASFYSQSMIGAGRTNLSGGGWTADSYIGQTGFSIKDGNGTFSVSNGTTAGFLTDYMTYRGIENWYGNVWKFIDGITWDASANNTSPVPVYVTGNKNYFADTGSVNMQLLCNASYIGTDAGWSSDIMNCVGFIPSAVGASDTTKITDYYWQYNTNGQGWRAPFFGGNSKYGSYAGGFALYSDNGFAVIDVTISARLCL